MRRIAKRRALVALGVALVGILVAVAAFAGSARGERDGVPGVKTPAVAANPKWAFIGMEGASPNVSVFGCQTRTIDNPLGACSDRSDPDRVRHQAPSRERLRRNGTDDRHRRRVPEPDDSAGPRALRHGVRPACPTLNIIAPDGLTPFDPNDANQVGWSAEISLDVQWAHAVAPGATIDLVLAKSNNDADILSATKYAYDNNLGDVLSQSFGEAEQCVDPSLLSQQHQLFDAMVAKGWTLFASSGDQGSNLPTCDGASLFQAASTPASDPDVTGVGGTQLRATPVVISVPRRRSPTRAASTRARRPGTRARRRRAAAASSVIYKRPDFQAPVVKDSKARALPDVAYNAAVNGGVIAFWGVPFGPGAAFRFGGTSAGSPQWAGLGAITDQLAGNRVGNINKTLYKLGKKSQGTYFHDVADGSNNGAFTATPGFDEATGWGSPIRP